ncbi:MAG: 3-carboxy-cis,cis-muconate cycloisomerase, partial [Egibacteraceae bacterium]
MTDSAWLQALLDAEAALARAAARAGRIPGEHADAIAAACRASAFDAGTLGAPAASSGNPVVPLVLVLPAAVPGAAA